MNIYYFLISICFLAFYNLSELFLKLSFPTIKYLFAGAALFFFGKAILKRNLWNLRGFLKVTFLIWTLVIIISGIPFIGNPTHNFVYSKQFFSSEVFIYIIPMLSLLHLDFAEFKKLLYLLFIFTAIFVIIGVLALPVLISDSANGGEYLGVIFAASGSILFLTSNYHSPRINVVVVLSLMLALVINALLARRNQVVYFGSVFIFSVLVNGFLAGRNFKFKRFRFLAGAFIIGLVGLAFLILNTDQFQYFSERFGTGFESRQDIVELFWSDMNQTPMDQLFGRGMFGQFAGGVLGDDDTGLRSVIENGYLYLILKGGFIYLALIVLMGLQAIYLGFFKSKNILCKAAASLVVIYFLDMIGFGLPSLSLKFIMIWIGMAICFNKNIRSMENSYLAEHLGIKKIW